MFHKRARPWSTEDEDPATRLRRNLGDLFLGNDVSGARAQSLFSDAQLAGAQHVSDLARAGARGRFPGNASRDLTARFLRGKGWPSLYKAKLRVWDVHAQCETTATLPMLLPHELIASLARRNSTDCLLVRDGMSNECKDHLQQIETKVNQSNLLGIGLWCDGVPYNWDRSQTLEVVSMSLPGLDGSNAQLRLLLFGVNKKLLLTTATFDDLFSVLSWSFRCLATGQHPSCRHDGLPFTKTDSKRKQVSETPIGLKGFLVEVRGDWAMMKQVFRFPAWNSLSGCCWLCKCTPATLRECGSHAFWRAARWTHYEFLAQQLQAGHTLSPLFSCPFLTILCFKPDWLHAVDQGCAADFLGSLLFYLLRFFPGNTQQEQCRNLFRDIRSFYVQHRVQSRYDNLTVKMFKTKHGYKLRGKAAEVRHLFPWTKLTCERLMDNSDAEQNTINAACQHLAACYEQLAGAAFQVDTMATHCKTLCLLMVALEKTTSPQKLWRVKPKLHLMQELCEMKGDNPAKYWCYRDEDFGGSLASYARHKGGANSFAASGTKMLRRYMAKHQVPTLQ